MGEELEHGETKLKIRAEPRPTDYTNRSLWQKTGSQVKTLQRREYVLENNFISSFENELEQKKGNRGRNQSKLHAAEELGAAGQWQNVSLAQSPRFDPQHCLAR